MSKAETLFLPYEVHPEFYTIKGVKLVLDMHVDNNLFPYDKNQVCSMMFKVLEGRNKFKETKLYGCNDSIWPTGNAKEIMYFHVKIINHKSGSYKQNISHDIISINIDVTRSVPLLGNFPKYLEKDFVLPITDDKVNLEKDIRATLTDAMNNFYESLFPRLSANDFKIKE